jgi:NAD(P)-dependent dehydrogenase (short-subunit alcohol dehydrogenase family)
MSRWLRRRPCPEYAPAMSAYDLEGKVVLITGGARGIGFETARAAHARGASVALVDLDPRLAAESAESIGERAIGIGADVTEATEIEAAVATAVEQLGRVDVVVANAGITPRKTTTRAIGTDEWERTLEVNLLGVYRTIRAGIEQVIANRGQFILISSSYAHANGIFNSSYATSKAAVEALGRALRAELAPHGASAGVAYFAFAKTDLIGDIFDNPVADRFRREKVPSFLTRPMEIDQPANAVIAGIEQRSARVIEPPVWRAPLYLRGLLGPLTDSRLDRDPGVGGFVAEIEALEQGDGPEPAADALGPRARSAGSDYDLVGKVVLITGGARGIGFETGRMAYGRGASVALVDLDPAQSEAAAAGLGPRAIGIGADVTDRESIEAAVARAKEEFGRVDVVVANAGIATRIASIRSLPAEDWERVLEVNLFGVWRTVRAGMDEVVRNGGQFVLVSSSYAYSNGVLNSAYAAAKAGVEAMGRALRAELRPLGASATVAYFGWIRTEMVRSAFEDPNAARFREHAPSFLTRQVPVSRAGRVIIDALESRSPRAIAPWEWKLIFHARGLTSPLMDLQLDTDATLSEIVLAAEAAELDRQAG